jgi:protease-4
MASETRPPDIRPSDSPDLLLDRRRLKRRLWFWRVVGVLGLAACAWLASGVELPESPRVARLDVSGIITGERELLEALDDASRDPAVRAILVAIDSPGGTAAGGEALHAALARAAARRPMVAVMAATAASAGYMAALPAARVFARESTVTGSIGVRLDLLEASELLARVGLRSQVLASGPLKGQPSLTQPLTEEGRAALQAVVDDMHEQFVARVAAGRRLEVAAVRPLADGRVLSGRQAVAAGLVDAIGGEPEARAWLEAARDVPADLPVRDIEVPRAWERAFARVLSLVAKNVLSEWLRVDALAPGLAASGR